MKKLTFSFILFSLVVHGLTNGFANWTEMINAQGNVFRAGTFDLQLSDTDSNGDGIADVDLVNWSNVTSGTWSSPDNWAPGEVFSNTLFIRENGTVDVGSIEWTMSGFSRNSDVEIDLKTNLVEAWYDSNANGIEDAGENILADLKSIYDTGDGVLTLGELNAGMNNGIGPYELESGLAVLPGSTTNSVVGGEAGTGKGLHLAWQFDESADLSYQGASVAIAFDFVGVNLE